MTEQFTGGGEQPGEPSLFRGHQRIETDVGMGIAVEGGTTKHLCLWPVERLSIQSCWAKVRAVLGDEATRVKRIVEVTQSDRQSRFDLWVDLADWVEVLACLRRAKHQHRWWVREHVNYCRSPSQMR